jgi:hypothetical protein
MHSFVLRTISKSVFCIEQIVGTENVRHDNDKNDDLVDNNSQRGMFSIFFVILFPVWLPPNNIFRSRIIIPCVLHR